LEKDIQKKEIKTNNTALGGYHIKRIFSYSLHKNDPIFAHDANNSNANENIINFCKIQE